MSTLAGQLRRRSEGGTARCSAQPCSSCLLRAYRRLHFGAQHVTCISAHEFLARVASSCSPHAIESLYQPQRNIVLDPLQRSTSYHETTDRIPSALQTFAAIPATSEPASAASSFDPQSCLGKVSLPIPKHRIWLCGN